MMEQLAKDIAELGGRLGKLAPAALKLARVSRNTEIFEPSERARLEEALPKGAQGWLRRESWVGLAEDDPGSTRGAPLEGEWVLEDGATSIALLYDGRAWRLISLTEVAGGDEAVLREDVRMIGRHTPGLLKYAVYWGGAPATRRLACRFLGLGGR